MAWYIRNASPNPGMLVSQVTGLKRFQVTDGLKKKRLPFLKQPLQIRSTWLWQAGFSILFFQKANVIATVFVTKGSDAQRGTIC